MAHPQTLPDIGWHWEEKNQLGWSRQKLQELLVGMLVDMSAVQGNAKVTMLKDLTGEVRPFAIELQFLSCTDMTLRFTRNKCSVR